MRTFAERLKATRKEKTPSLSQKDLAELSGVSQTTIANIESGRNESTKHIFALAHALGVRAQWLKDGIEPKTADAQLDENPASPEIVSDEIPAGLKKIQKAYMSGGPAKQEALVLLANLPEQEMATLLLVFQSIGSKYKR